MVLIGIDPHKATHTAVAVDTQETALAELTVWASPGLTDIQHQGRGPGKDVQNGDHGTEEAPSPSVVHPGVQG
jgi:hypothetical protein